MLYYTNDNLADRHKYNCIDLVKFICSILVIMIHVVPFGSKEEYAWLNYGIQHYFARIAVPFFFCTSGFFLFKKINVESFDFRIIVQYAKRIMRLYIIWSIIYLPLNMFLLVKSEQPVRDVLILCRNTIFAGSYVHLWYLTALAFAVLLIGILLNKKIKLKRIGVISMFLYFIGLLGNSYFGILKILQPYADVWNVLKVIEKVIVGTRNGLFFGLVFVTMGGIIVHRKRKMTIKTSLLSFCISMLLMLIEAVLVRYFDFVLDAPDMYICLIPTIWFMFHFVSNIQFKDSKIWLMLRHMSSLIYYIHLWMMHAIRMMFKIFLDYDIEGKSMLFLLTCLCSVIGAYIIVRLSEKDRFRWLEKCYL